MTRTESGQTRGLAGKAKGSSTGTIRTSPGCRRHKGSVRPNLPAEESVSGPFLGRRKFSKCRTFQADQRIWLRLGWYMPAAEVLPQWGLRRLHQEQPHATASGRHVVPSAEGPENLIAIKVCDFPRVRLDGMYEWQELSMIWSGVYRPVCLEITPPFSLMTGTSGPGWRSQRPTSTSPLSTPLRTPLRVVLQAMDGTRLMGRNGVTVPAG